VTLPLRSFAAGAALAVVAASSGCVHPSEAGRNNGEIDLAGAPASPESRAARDAARAHRALTGHVIIVSIDGLRPDAIAKYHASTLERLSRDGRYALQARTIVPSTTMPSHASMLTGVNPSRHHVLWNDDERTHDAMRVPTIFGIVKHEGLSTAAFYSKSKFSQLIPRNALDIAAAPTQSEGIWLSESTVARAIEHLRNHAPGLLFVHLGEPDYAGHARGWMTDEYASAVLSADAALGRLLAGADSALGPSAYTVIVTSDHGGHARTHGTRSADDLLIPWVAWGAGVQPGAPLNESIRTMDTAATALWLLGIEVPRDWSGRAVTSAFVAR
jgi:predicted AlkP superfamily pyrophosphatase or phosphodiesterase